MQRTPPRLTLFPYTTLFRSLGETVNVAVFREGAAINLYQAQGASTVALHNWVGDRTVLHATSSGKMLMAHLDDVQRDQLLAAPVARCSRPPLNDTPASRSSGAASC